MNNALRASIYLLNIFLAPNIRMKASNITAVAPNINCMRYKQIVKKKKQLKHSFEVGQLLIVKWRVG